jgi:hypothetical protein
MVPPAPTSGFHPAASNSPLAASSSEKAGLLVVEALIVINAFTSSLEIPGSRLTSCCEIGASGRGVEALLLRLF